MSQRDGQFPHRRHSRDLAHFLLEAADLFNRAFALQRISEHFGDQAQPPDQPLGPGLLSPNRSESHHTNDDAADLKWNRQD
jgi:hypothetical protein